MKNSRKAHFKLLPRHPIGASAQRNEYISQAGVI